MLLPSLALISQLADHGHGPVGLESCRRAAAWCDLFEEHARRVYGLTTVGAHSAARVFLARLRAGKLPSPFGARDVYRSEWSGLTDPDAVDAAIAILERHGWVRRDTVQTGGRPRVEIYVHPSLYRREAAE